LGQIPAHKNHTIIVRVDGHSQEVA
jgi:hypothetical protein